MGIQTDLSPGLGLLKTLGRSFLKLPYENISKIQGWDEAGNGEPRLETPEQIWGNFLREGTGGTCFSLTALLHATLTDLGFEASIVLADRPYGKETHCLVIVDLEETKWGIDPGFLIYKPMILPSQGAQLIPYQPYSLLIEKAANESYCVGTIDNHKQYKFRYSFYATPASKESFENAWRHSFSWKGWGGLSLSRRIPGGQLYCHNLDIRWVYPQKKIHIKMREGDFSAIENLWGIPQRLFGASWEIYKGWRDPSKKELSTR